MADKKSQESQDPAAIWVEPSRLKPWDGNPRQNDAAVPRIAESIREFGFGAPIVAQAKTERIIAGHTRLKAAMQLGLDLVPVRYLDVTDAQAMRLTVADNKLGEIAEWDNEKLVELLKGATLNDAMSMGFELSELDKLMKLDAPATQEDLEIRYQIVVSCDDEGQQAELLERFESEGLSVKALMA